MRIHRSPFNLFLALAATGILVPAGLDAIDFIPLEDFERYTEDADLESFGGWKIVEVNNPLEIGGNPDDPGARWTIKNAGGRANPPTLNGAPSTGQFLISDSDHACCADGQGSGRSHDIWSPPFDCTGSSAVWLHTDLSAQLNNNGLVVFDIDVSVDGGANWTNVFRRVAPERSVPPLPVLGNADGYYGRLDVNLSPVAANQANVMFRLRQFEPDDDWWIAVDDLVVDDVPPPLGGAVTLLSSEDFTSGIPGSWNIRSLAVPENTGNDTWNANDPCFRAAAKRGQVGEQDINSLGASFAIMDSKCDAAATPEDDYLITPVLDCEGATEIFLHYRDEILFNPGVTAEVLLSLDGGDTFEPDPIFSYSLGALGDSEEDPFYHQRVFSVPGAAGARLVAFAFHFLSGGDSNWWAVTDVKVTANGSITPDRGCGNRRFRADRFNTALGTLELHWDHLAGDEGFRILRNGAPVGGDLPATATGFTDSNIPAGTISVSYTLQSLKGGSVEFECTTRPVSVLACPLNLVCCVDSSTQSVTLSWKNGINVAGTGWRISRNDVPVKTVPLTVDTYTDSTLPGAGEYTYQLVLNGGDPLQCPDLPLECHVVLREPTQGIIFAEDFESYLDDQGLPSDRLLDSSCWELHEENFPSENALWTLTNPGSRAHPPLPNGAAPLDGATNLFIISDSDHADGDDGQGGGRSHDIWSPPFNCTGKSVVWLHMDASFMLNNNGLVVADIDVTTTNGASWTNVFRRVAPQRSVAPLPLVDIPAGLPGGPQAGNADAFFGRLDVDLSSVAANQPRVRFRLRQFEPSDDWWLAVDNVLVDSVPATGGNGVILPAEAFTDGIPSTWTVATTSTGTAGWSVGDPCKASLLNFNGGVFYDPGNGQYVEGADGRRIHHFDEKFALAFVDQACAVDPAQDEYLITPVLDCSKATAVFLHFKSAIVATNAIAEVLLSLDGGKNFNTDAPIFSYSLDGLLLRDTGNAEMVYNEYVFEVPDAIGSDSVAFAFHYLSSNGAPWGIDDVKVTATLSGVPPLAPTGLAATAGDGKVTLDWADNGDAGILGYHVYRAAGGVAEVKITTSPVAGSSYEDTGLTNGVAYCYRVSAVNGISEGPLSTVACATPKTAGALFRRGDVDGNGKIEVTDAIGILGHLFLGDNTAWNCAEAADTDNDTKVDVTDAVNNLNFQFLGGTPPAPPGPRVCGPDEGPTFLGCDLHC